MFECDEKSCSSSTCSKLRIRNKIALEFDTNWEYIRRFEIKKDKI